MLHDLIGVAATIGNLHNSTFYALTYDIGWWYAVYMPICSLWWEVVYMPICRIWWYVVYMSYMPICRICRYIVYDERSYICRYVLYGGMSYICRYVVYGDKSYMYAETLISLLSDYITPWPIVPRVYIKCNYLSNRKCIYIYNKVWVFCCLLIIIYE